MAIEDVDFEMLAKLVKGNRIYIEDLKKYKKWVGSSLDDLVLMAGVLLDLGILKGSKVSIDNLLIINPENNKPEIRWYIEGK